MRLIREEESRGVIYRIYFCDECECYIDIRVPGTVDVCPNCGK